ncbi:MAG: Uma2 family endonuclease [Dehalococcoidia bacterium]
MALRQTAPGPPDRPAAVARRRRPITYPETDPRIMPDTPAHFDALIRLLLILRAWFAARPDVFVGGDMMFYWVAGDPKQALAPDLFVAFGVRRDAPRRVWKTWEEAVPAVVVEITSRKTRTRDTERKYRLYEDLGVAEYFLFDPLGEYLRPPLRGYRLTTAGGYAPLAADGRGWLASETLGLWLAAGAGHVRLFDGAVAELLSPQERVAEAEARAEAAERQLRALQHRPPDHTNGAVE